MSALPKQIVAQGKYLQMVKAGHWEYVERPNIPGAVVILAVTPQNELLLVEQERIPLSNRVIELPAGLAGDEGAGESFADCARRELIEETGYEATEMILLAEGPTSAGLANEQVSLFHARGLRAVNAGGGVASEDITVHHVPVSEIASWLQIQHASRGVLIDIKIWAGLYFLSAQGSAGSGPASAAD